jgi:hypothetical protein
MLFFLLSNKSRETLPGTLSSISLSSIEKIAWMTDAPCLMNKTPAEVSQPKAAPWTFENCSLRKMSARSVAPGWMKYTLLWSFLV